MCYYSLESFISVGLIFMSVSENGPTQEQLAEKPNFSGRTVSHREYGDNKPEVSIIVMLADFMTLIYSSFLTDKKRESERIKIKPP